MEIMVVVVKGFALMEVMVVVVKGFALMEVMVVVVEGGFACVQALGFVATAVGADGYCEGGDEEELGELHCEERNRIVVGGGMLLMVNLWLIKDCDGSE